MCSLSLSLSHTHSRTQGAQPTLSIEVLLKANKSTIKEMCALLEALELNTDLSINIHKSIIYFSKGCSNRAELKALLGFSVGNPSNREEGLQRIVTNRTNK